MGHFCVTYGGARKDQYYYDVLDIRSLHLLTT